MYLLHTKNQLELVGEVMSMWQLQDLWPQSMHSFPFDFCKNKQMNKQHLVKEFTTRKGFILYTGLNQISLFL